jgi:Tol biopolymer transport system component
VVVDNSSPYCVICCECFCLIRNLVPPTNPELKVDGISRVSTYLGDEREPSLSPDGRRVAFSWGGDTGENRDIYTKSILDPTPVRLTTDPAEDALPAWSPDGKHIAFIRRGTGTRADILLVPTTGGAERKLHEIKLNRWLSTRALAWTPDGRWICFTDETGVAGHHRLFLLSPDSNTVKPLLPLDENGFGDLSPFNSKLLLQRLSPDLTLQGTLLVVENAGANPTSPVWMSSQKFSLLMVPESWKLTCEAPRTRSIFRPLLLVN